MTTRQLLLALAASFLLLVACGDDSGTDGTGSDVVHGQDVSAEDTGAADSGITDTGDEPSDVAQPEDTPSGTDNGVVPQPDIPSPNEDVVNPTQTHNTEGGPSWLFDDGLPVGLDPATARHDGPADWRDEIIYFVMTDRFRDGDAANNEQGFRDDGTPLHNPANPIRYHGGDFQGLIDGRDYLRRLGVTALWMTPIVENVIEDASRTGYAGYWAHDFGKVDPHLLSGAGRHDTEAGRTEYADFVSDMHDAGLLIIQDIVVNHVGNLALYYLDGEENWDPPYNADGYGPDSHLFIDDSSHAEEDWVAYGMRTKPAPPFDNPAYYHNCGRNDSGVLGDLHGLDDIATEKPEVRQAFIDIYGGWIDTANVDGFRIDTVVNVEADFWATFSPAIRDGIEAGRKFLQFGEAYGVSHNQAGRYLENEGLDSLLNFDFAKVSREVFAEGKSTNRLRWEIEARDALRVEGFGGGGAELGAAEAAVNFIDNHDDNRFLDEPDANEHGLRAALMYLLTAPGIPCIYYGSEIDARGVTKTAEGGRIDIPDLTTTGKLTFKVIQAFAKLRQEHVALRRGGFETLAETNDAAGLFAFARATDDPSETVVVVMNTADQPLSTRVPLNGSLPEGATVTDLVLAEFGQDETHTVSGDEFTVSLEPYDCRIYKVQ